MRCSLKSDAAYSDKITRAFAVVDNLRGDMKKRVLFVMAEPSDLASLQTMLAPLSDEWEL